MRAPNKAGAVVMFCVLVIALLCAGPAGARTRAPTRAQIRSAIHTATHSKLLWATIDSCAAAHSDTVGIRGEMPALPFASHLLMIVTVDEWSPTKHRYIAIKRHWRLGGDQFDGRTVVQNGLRLNWSGQVTVKASIEFRWLRSGKLLGSAKRTTTGGHAKADSSGFSAAACSIS